MKLRWAQGVLCLGAVGGIVLATSLGTRVVPAERSAGALADAAEAILADELRTVEAILSSSGAGEPADVLAARLGGDRTVSGLALLVDGAVVSSTGSALPPVTPPEHGLAVVAVGRSWWRLAQVLPDGRVAVADLGLERVEQVLGPIRRSAGLDLVAGGSTSSLATVESGAGVTAERGVGATGLRVRASVAGSTYATSPLMVVIAGVAAAAAVVIAVVGGLDRRRANAVVRDQQAEIADLARRFDVLAHTDPLTGAGNEVRFLQELRGFFSRHERYDRPYAVAVLEIDHLDAYVATYGAARADDVRVAVARTLLAQARTGDAVFRLRDDRFAVVLPEQTPDLAGIAAERCRQAVATLRLEHLRNPASGIVTLTAGVAAAEPGDQAPVAPFERATQALGRAVLDGRACTRVAAPSPLLDRDPSLPRR